MLPLEPGQRDTLFRYATDTWACLATMADLDIGLPASSLCDDLIIDPATSITDIAAYLWSVLVAARLGIIGRIEAVWRLNQTLDTLATLERHVPSGQFYNWYDHHTGGKSTINSRTGESITPILSSVDNGWLATALHVVATSMPKTAAKAAVLFDSMNFDCYYRPELNQLAVFYAPEAPETARAYDTIVSESRIASYIGIATGRLPPKAYFGPWRTFPEHYERSRQKVEPSGFHRTYLGVDVFEGAYSYGGMRIVPGWGGSMFEALMPALFVPEEIWGAKSWAINHPLTIKAQMYHGLVETDYGYWGFSPANIPEGGYGTYGVAAIGMSPDGYASGGVVTPHASFLALRWEGAAALENLARLEHDFPIYGQWGFRDSVNVLSGAVSNSYLALDQGIIMAAIGNALRHDMLRRAFATPDFRNALRPILSIEEFNAGPRDRGAQIERVVSRHRR